MIIVFPLAAVSHGDAAGSDVTQFVKKFAIATPQPVYPEAARLQRITGLGYFKMRVQRATGRVKEVSVLRSTGNQLLDAASIKALSQWRFKAGVLPSIKQLHPSSHDPLANEDFLIAVPVHFQLQRNGVITKT